MTQPPEMRAPACPVDFMSETFTPDAIAGCRAIRDAGPVVWYRPGRGFVITGYRDTVLVLRDSRFAAFNMFHTWPKLARKLGRNYSDAIELMTYMPFRSDGLRHDQLRRALARGVAPYANGHPAIRARIDRNLAGVAKDGGFDLSEQFAKHLFFDILCDLMEIGEDERAIIRPIATMSRLLESTAPISHRDRFARQVGECISFLRERVEQAVTRQEPGFITGIYRALPDDEPDRLRATAILATVAMMMANDGIGACITFPVFDLLSQTGRDDGPLVPQSQWADISDDAIRYATPVSILTRTAAADVEIAGCEIKRGEVVNLSLLCANHDPAEFGEWADAVSVKPGKGMGVPFGAGSHVCVGNRLSRIVAKQAYEALAQMPQMEISGDAIYGNGMVVRTITSLPVEFK